ncbi:DUF87 domain-containing protein [Candidatus Shapirobacteria bacterium]|nr:DUF87 domain-containing protein [Candidatus Shapirobacteria bacterium]
MDKIIFEIKVPRENEYTTESSLPLLSGFTRILSSPSFFDQLKGRPGESLALEIVCDHQRIHFCVVLEESQLPYFESQILASYPSAILNRLPDYFPSWSSVNLSFGQMVLNNSHFYPLKNYKDFAESDPLANLLAVMSKGGEEDKSLVQLVIQKAPSGWQRQAQKAVEAGIKISQTERKPLPGENLIRQKIQEEGLKVGLRIAASNPNLLKSLAGSFAIFTQGDGNSLVFQKAPMLKKEKFKKAVLERSALFTPKFQILTVSETASLWHLPGPLTKIPNIAWGRQVVTEAPENLPASSNLTEEQKLEINFFAKTEFKNRLVNFGIKQGDRRRHMYIIGKTGTGKTTLIANMAIDDMKKKHGLAVIDPHGDLSEILLDYVPSHRINEVCYLDPSDKEHPFALNILEVKDQAQAELIVSGIISIFYKIYAFSWGPRLEYILRNVLLTLTQTPGSTLIDITRILTEKDFRRHIVERLNDQVLRNFWLNEFEKMPDRLQQEAISPILNKVGQFVSSPSIRSIIGQPKSTIDLEKVMNEGKILILNLSQGRLGEDNAALLGAMIISKIQLAAMNRASIPESQRKDFYLYVDEFQNFATESFIKILSEARKYRLNLCLANQYMAQIVEPVQKAIFGNAGTLASFIVGAEDANILEKEFGGIFTQKDLVGLSNFQIIIKLTIDNLTSRPFFAYTLPLPQSVNQNRQKVINVSAQRYSYQPQVIPPRPQDQPQSRPSPPQPQYRPRPHFPPRDPRKFHPQRDFRKQPPR